MGRFYDQSPNQYEINKVSHEINDDSVLAKVIIAGNRFVQLGSIYINPPSAKNIKATLNKLKNLIPQEEKEYAVFAGDWNIDSLNQKNSKFRLLKELAIAEGWKIKTAGVTRKNRGIDFVIHGSQVRISDVHATATSLSDHNMINFKIDLDQPTKSTKRMKVQDRKAAELITTKAMQISISKKGDAKTFLEIHNELRKKTRLEKEIRKKQA